jgi:hypothetical protein
MFQPFDLDPEEKAFWENGLSLAAKYLDELTTPAADTPLAAPKKGKTPRSGK